MKTFYTIVFVVAFFVPALFVMYGVFFSFILLFSAITSGDYSWFLRAFLSSIGGGAGSFAAAQLLDLTFNARAKIMRPLWIKLFLLAGLLSLTLALVNLQVDFNIPTVFLLLMPIPVVLYLMFINRQYLWVKKEEDI